MQLSLRSLGAKALGAATLIAALTLAACGGSSSSPGGTTASTTLTACHVTPTDLQVGGAGAAATPTPPQATAGLTGMSLQIDGSSALQPLFQAAQPYFDQANGTHTTTVANGSGNGLKDVESGAVQIGLSDFFYQENTSYANDTDLVDHRMAVVAFTLVVSSDIQNSVQNLTSQQILNIYTGKTTNWSQIGGPNELITVINRPLVSGTRATFKKFVLNGTTESAGTTLTQDTTGAVATAINNAQGAIGYVATGFALDSAKYPGIFPICIDGYGATSANINTGNYKFWSYEHAYTKGPANPLEQAYLNYVLSGAVQNTLLPTLGFLQVGQLTAAAMATHPLPAGATK